MEKQIMSPGWPDGWIGDPGSGGIGPCVETENGFICQDWSLGGNRG